MHSTREHSSFFFRSCLGLERLEGRHLLSVGQFDDSGNSQIDIGIFPISPSDQPEAADLLPLETRGEWNAGVLHPNEPLPVIPYDDSVDPFSSCPAFGPEYCLPGDADANGSVDFLDLLLLAKNFGMENATWSNGDFNDDGRVTFQDFMILAHNFGSVA